MSRKHHRVHWDIQTEKIIEPLDLDDLITSSFIRHIADEVTDGSPLYVNSEGEFGLSSTVEASSVPTGTVSCFAGSSAPSGYLLCNASAVSRTTYASLFSVIGTTYGVGNGSTTFNLPDMRGRVPVGTGTGTYKSAGLFHSNGASLTARTLGEYAGAEYPTGQVANTANPDTDEITGTVICMQMTDSYHTTTPSPNTQLASNTEGGNMQPYLSLNYIIKF